MTALVLAEVDVHDAEAYRRYMAATPPTIAAFGGWFVFRNGPRECLEGTDTARRIVLIAFPDAEAAGRWYRSEGYTQARGLRSGCATARLVLLNETEFAAPT